MSDQSYALKEMVSKILEQNERSLITQTEILARAMSVDEHLKLLNSKVAKNVHKISELEKEHTTVKAYAVAVSALFGVIITGVNLFLK